MAGRLWRGERISPRADENGRVRRAVARVRQYASDVEAGPRHDPTRVRVGEIVRVEPGRDSAIPRWLEVSAGWTWRLLLLGLLIYVLGKLAGVLAIVVLPCVAALLLTALLQPLSARLRRYGWPAMASTWAVLLLAILVIAGLGTLIGVRTSMDYSTLVSDVEHTTHQLETWLAGPPFHIKKARLEQLETSAKNAIVSHKSLVAGTVVTGGKYATEIAAGLVLTIFVTFFLIKDGDRIWGWLIGFLSPDKADRADRAGKAAWHVLVHYVRGTVLVAAFHGIVVGLTLWFLGVPLVVPLATLVFLAAFIPLVGILFAGVLSIGVTLGTKGWLAAVILLAVFLVEDQLDAHVLQPQVVGRIIRLHPLAVILVLAVGGELAGIPGAVVAVPTAAAIARAAPELRRPADPDEEQARAEEQADPQRAEDEEDLGEEHVPM